MRSVPDRFRAAMQANPNAVAVSAPDGYRLRYVELDEWSTALAWRLRDSGVRAEEAVAVRGERSVEMVVALLGILKAGAAYVPIDPAEPPARVAEVVADARIRTAVVDQRAADPFGGVRVDPVHVGGPPTGSAAEQPPAPHPATLAYLMYTSGSTGGRKAVMVEHRNITNLVTSPTYVTLGPADRVLHLAPATFDAATFEVWGALLNGACLVLAPPGPLPPDDIARVVAEAGVTVLWLTAALLHEQIEERIDTFRGMRTVLAGGDVLSPAQVRRLRTAMPECAIVNGYGPTETTTFACCHVVDPTEPLDPSVPVGRPIQNVQVHILDASGCPVPDGDTGELYIGGAGVSRGYWRRPALTARQFRADPYSAVAGARLYRTGDRARRRPDGVVEFLGRLDDQFKLRGYRIEPGEIEAVLTALDGVRQAVVALRRSPVGDDRIVAYVTLDAGHPFDPVGLRRRVAGRLPAYLVPAVVVPLARLPVTANGKVDRSALPTPDWSNRAAYR